MVAIATLLGLALPFAVLAAPAPAKLHLVEQTPWVLSDITVFRASQGSSAPSYINFLFSDVNQGLEIKTQCTRFALPGASVDTSSGQYVGCANSTVKFALAGHQLKLQRTYRDDSVGAPPYNYVTAFGDGNATFAEKTGACGCAKTLKRLDVPITALIA